MENTTAVEPKAEKSATPGIWTKQPVKKPGPKTENAQMEKTATVKEEPVKETASVNKKANEKKTNAESDSAEKVTVIAEKKNPSKKTTKKQTAKKKATTKKTVKKKINKEIESFFDENSNPEIMLIVEENPNEMIFNTIVESELELPVSKKKNKKGIKSDKKKAAKKHTLCKLVKNDFLKKHFSEYKDLAANPEWICRKCGRVANDPKFLCKPILLSKIDNGDIIIS